MVLVLVLLCFGCLAGIFLSLLYVKGGRNLNIEYLLCYLLDTEEHHWKMRKCFDGNASQVLDVQFGDGQTCLKLVSVVIIVWSMMVKYLSCKQKIMLN